MGNKQSPESDNSLGFCHTSLSGENPLFNRCMDNLPGVPAHAICYYMDGNKHCCVFGDFRNLQEDPVGFGNSDEEAYQDLKSKYKRDHMKKDLASS